MHVWLDSATPPNPTQVAAAKTAGVVGWGGYLSSAPFDGKSHFNLMRPWSQAEFAVVKALPGVPLAFASGWDDPGRCRALAQAWGVRLCLDVEGGIRGDGPWVQPWLDAAACGLYSFASAFPGRRMAFAILADRSATPPDPGATWAPWHARPVVPCGWQWWGSHSEFGVTVDRNWLDDWFGGMDMTQQEHDWLASIVTALGLGAVDATKWPVATPNFNYPKELADIKARLAAIEAAPGGTAPSYQGSITLTPK